MKLEEIKLRDMKNNSNKIYIKLNKGVIVKLLKESSKGDLPHRNKEFCRKIKVCFNEKIKASPTVISWIKFNRAIPLSKLSIMIKESGQNLENIEKETMSLQKSLGGGKVSINFPIKLGKEIGSIIGHILGDGSIDKKYQQVFFSNSNKELIEEFSKNMEFLFKVKPRIWMQETANFEGKTRWEKRLSNINELEANKNCGLFYPAICGVILNEIFGNFAIGRVKKISKEIIMTNQEFKKGLIRAFYDDEGTVGEKSIRLFQDRKDILESFRFFLKDFDIYPGETKSYIKKDKERYYFDIHRKSNLIKFKDKIGFTSSKKINKLKEISVIKRPTMSK